MVNHFPLMNQASIFCGIRLTAYLRLWLDDKSFGRWPENYIP